VADFSQDHGRRARSGSKAIAGGEGVPARAAV